MKCKQMGWMLMVVLVGGCAAMPTEGAKAGSAKAECLVCKKNADLACVELEVDAKTPRAEYGGKTYYFCSEECKAAFLKEPARYVTAKQ